MLKLTKLFKITPKDKIKPGLNNLYLKNNKIYATNGFGAIVLDYTLPEKKGFISKLDAKIHDLKLSEGAKSVLNLNELVESYPDVDALLNKVSFHSEIILDRKLLIHLIEALQEPQDNSYDEIRLSIPKESGQPFKIENKNGIGLIMPRKDDKY